MTGTVVLASGGLDSTVLLTAARTQGPVHALSVNYGQRHRREIDHARRVSDVLGITHEVVDLGNLSSLLPSVLTTGGAIPHGHYTDEAMKSTVVPNRNMLLLALAGAAAVAREFDRVAYAAHAGDHAIYPDCRPAFVEPMQAAFAALGLTLEAPYARWTKADIVREGRRLAAPLALTWSCYEGGDLHCGRCGTCHERREAFALAGEADPTSYAS